MSRMQLVSSTYFKGQNLNSLKRLFNTSSGLNTAKADNVHPGYFKIKAIQARFQVDNNIPVHLKGGPFDHVLYYSTIGMAVVGLSGVIHYFYTAAFPKKIQ